MRWNKILKNDFIRKLKVSTYLTHKKFAITSALLFIQYNLTLSAGFRFGFVQ